MNGRYFSLGNPRTPGNPFAQALSLLVFAVLLVGAVFMGAIVLATLVGLAVIGYLALRIRAWWLGRQPRGRGPNGGGGPGRPAKGIRYIEGEYEVIDADAEAARRRTGQHR
jgi:hypothetical protein